MKVASRETFILFIILRLSGFEPRAFFSLRSVIDFSSDALPSVGVGDIKTIKPVYYGVHRQSLRYEIL